MHTLGNISLYLGLAGSIIGALLLFMPLKALKNISYKSGTYLGLVGCVFVVFATALLLFSLIRGDYTLLYVYNSTDSSLPLIYKISALWSGSAGSMMFWDSALCIMLILIFIFKKGDPSYINLQRPLLILSSGFMGMITFMYNPFEYVSNQANGFGLNPALQSLGMVIHPPVLIIGFCCFLIAFGYGLHLLFSQDEAYLKTIRIWCLWGYALLTFGIITGGLWAYTELGWGGYWSWDPVENMSLVNWMLATALIHYLAKKNKKPLKLFLLLASTAYSILLGTFITRSGILKSVHAYSGGKVAMMLGGFIGVIGVSMIIVLIIYKIKVVRIKSDQTKQSKNRLMDLGIILSILMAIMVVGGTLYPLASRMIGFGSEVTPITYYEYGFGLLGLLLLSLLGFTKKQGKFHFNIVGGIVGCICFILLSIFFTVSLIPKIAISILAMVVVNTIWEHIQHHKGWKSKKAVLCIHVGVVILGIGIVCSKSMEYGGVNTIELTETMAVGDYLVNYADYVEEVGERRTTITTHLNIRDGNEVLSLAPQLSYYHKRGIVHGRATVVRGVIKDLHIILRGMNEDGGLVVEIKSIGFMSLIWLGSFILILGFILRLKDVHFIKKVRLAGNTKEKVSK